MTAQRLALVATAITIPSFFDNRLKADGLASRILRISCGVIILLFFIFYVSSGMVAGGSSTRPPSTGTTSWACS